MDVTVALISSGGFDVKLYLFNKEIVKTYSRYILVPHQFGYFKFFVLKCVELSAHKQTRNEILMINPAVILLSLKLSFKML
jgi:hypothetical protein